MSRAPLGAVGWWPYNKRKEIRPKQQSIIVWASFIHVVAQKEDIEALLCALERPG